MNIRRLTVLALLVTLSACTTPIQNLVPATIVSPDLAPLLRSVGGPLPEVNFNLLRPAAAPANLLVSPNDLSVSAWVKGPGLAVQANAEPNLSRLSVSAGNNTYIGQRSSATAAGTYSARVFLKGSGRVVLFMQRSGGDYAIYARQDLVLTPAGVLVTISANKPADGLPIQLGLGDLQSSETVLAGQAEMVFGSFEVTPPTPGNLLTEASNFAAPVWNKGAITVQTNIDGDFDQITSSTVGYINQRVTATAAGTYTGKITLRGTGPVAFFLQRGGSDYLQYNRQIVTLSAQAVQVSLTAQKPDDGFPIQLGISSIDAGDVVLASLAELSVATTAAPTITAVTLSANPTSLNLNQASRLQATVSGTGAFSGAVTLKVLPTTAAITALANGGYEFKATAAGTYTITATSAADATKSSSTTVTVTTPVPSTSLGAWSGVLPLPIPPIHAALLPTGKVIFWAYDEDSSSNLNKLTRTFVWNPVLNDTPLAVNQPNSKLFCSAHSLLPDGRLLTIGGILRPTPLGQPQLGVKDTNLFNSSSNTWSKAADMQIARYYPSSVPLANGDILAIAGTNDTNGANLETSEVWQTTSNLPETDPGRYRLLSTAKYSQGWYPMAFQAPNGKVFNVGPQPTMGYLDTTGTGTWTSLGDRTDPANSLGNGKRSYGTATMYEPGKIVLIGGVDPPTNTAIKIDINGSSPVVTQVGSMLAARRQHNATILADGTVLVTGGTSGPGFNNAAQGLLTTELWNPASGLFKTLKGAATPRLYHSLALLLPDARVLSAGGDGSDAPSYPNAEIFTPPYLLNSDGTPAVRPSIVSAPTSITFNSSFALTVGTGTGTGTTEIARMSLIKLSSVTHSTNFDQRFLNLSFTKTGTGLSVTAPSSGNLAPPGFYMLFALNAAGVPSIAKMLKLN